MEDLTKEVKELKRFKDRSGWSFDKIAARIGVSGQTVRNWFKGRYSPAPYAKERSRNSWSGFLKRVLEYKNLYFRAFIILRSSLYGDLRASFFKGGEIVKRNASQDVAKLR